MAGFKSGTRVGEFIRRNGSFPRPPSILSFRAMNGGRLMVVKIQSKGREITGLQVGANNARRYFPRGTAVIELELDHLRIQCALAPDFWLGEAEIHDSRLGAWLESKHFLGRQSRAAVPLAMIPNGKNSFRLRPIALSRYPRTKPSTSAFNAA
jgi:hypothetical protein